MNMRPVKPLPNIAEPDLQGHLDWLVDTIREVNNDLRAQLRTAKTTRDQAKAYGEWQDIIYKSISSVEYGVHDGLKKVRPQEPTSVLTLMQSVQDFQETSLTALQHVKRLVWAYQIVYHSEGYSDELTELSMEFMGHINDLMDDIDKAYDSVQDERRAGAPSARQPKPDETVAA